MAEQLVNELIGMGSKLSDVSDMLEETTIQIAKASDELCHYCDRSDLDPNRLFGLGQHISKQILLTRKHHISLEALPQYYQSLLEERQRLDDQADSREAFALAVMKHHQQALKIARALHQQRQQYAEELAQLVTDSMHVLSMPHRQFTTDVKFDEYHPGVDGADRTEFRVTANPGQPMQPIAEVASGGELSRIALATQITATRKVETPAPIFDEVDTGISGPTVAVVGKLLRQLGKSTQVMCVTHLSQVAGCGHQHYFASKETDDAMTETYMQFLNKKTRLQELARLPGGSEVTRNTLANAKELFAAQTFLLLHGQGKQQDAVRPESERL